MNNAISTTFTFMLTGKKEKPIGCVRKNTPSPPHLLQVTVPHCGHHVMLYNWSPHVAPVVCSRLSLRKNKERKKKVRKKTPLIGEDSEARSMWILLWANR